MKRGNYFIGFILLAFALSGCEFESYKDYSFPEYDGEFTFTEVNSKADWKNRYGHAAVTYDNKLWIFGGYNPGEIKNDTYYEDVWSSEDGENWELVTDEAPWNGRKGHTVNVFDDGTGEAMYLIGGFSVNEETGYRQYNNDVWKSTDGLSWENIKATTFPDSIGGININTFHPRMDHACVVANHGGQDYLYLIAGRTQLTEASRNLNQKYFRDVWRSSDGIDWEKLATNDFGIRAGHSACVDPATGTIYMQGGQHGINFELKEDENHPVPDWTYLWSSTDGLNWTSNCDSDFNKSNLDRLDHKLIFYDGAIWSFPGKSNSTMHYHFSQSQQYQIIKIEPGTENLWSVDSEGTAINGRHSYGVSIFNNKIWILGGFTTDLGQDNDVWTAEIN